MKPLIPRRDATPYTSPSSSTLINKPKPARKTGLPSLRHRACRTGLSEEPPINSYHREVRHHLKDAEMYFLVYVSSASEPMSRSDLEALLIKARENNAALNVTGMLLYKDGNFMQLLEGSREAIEALHQKIKEDPRHRSVITLLTGETATREFKDWTMGFRDLRTPQNERVPGYNEFLNTPLFGQEFERDPSKALKLLLTFKRSM